MLSNDIWLCYTNSPRHLKRIACAGLLYCMDFLSENLDWLEERLAPLLQGLHATTVPQSPAKIPSAKCALCIALPRGKIACMQMGTTSSLTARGKWSSSHCAAGCRM